MRRGTTETYHLLIFYYNFRQKGEEIWEENGKSKKANVDSAHTVM